MEKSIVHETPIGALKIVANDEGICAVKWLFGKYAVSPNDSLDKVTYGTSKSNKHLRACQKWLNAYFDRSLLVTRPEIPKPPLVLPDKSPFFHSVWEALLSSGIGETLTYKELAGRSGKPKAARAVGTAVRSHHLPILVPCHRVVKTSGQHATSKRVPYEIGQYSGGEGPETKQWLLAHEQAMLKQKL